MCYNAAMIYDLHCVFALFGVSVCFEIKASFFLPVVLLSKGYVYRSQHTQRKDKDTRSMGDMGCVRSV